MGGAGDDLLEGGAGADVYVLRTGDGRDRIVELPLASGVELAGASEAGFQTETGATADAADASPDALATTEAIATHAGNVLRFEDEADASRLVYERTGSDLSIRYGAGADLVRIDGYFAAGGQSMFDRIEAGGVSTLLDQFTQDLWDSRQPPPASPAATPASMDDAARLQRQVNLLIQDMASFGAPTFSADTPTTALSREQLLMPTLAASPF